MRGEQARRGFANAAFISLAISLLVLFALIFAVSPMNGEDYALTTPSEGMSLWERMSWIVGKAHRHIVRWNARLGEQLAIFWLTQPKSWFVAANTLVYAAFCAALAGVATGAARLDRSFLRAWLAICALCFLFWPRLEMFFWGTAAAGYLHPLTLTMVLLLPYAVPDLRKRLEESRLALAAWCMVGLAAGLSFESLPPAVLAYCTFEILRLIRSGVAPFRRRLVIPAAFYAVGWAVLMAAPSTTSRANWYRTHFGIRSRWLSPFYLSFRAAQTFETFWSASSVLLLVFLACAALVLVSRHRQALLPGRLLALLAAGVLSSLAVVVAPYTEPRAFAFLWIAMLTLMTRWLTNPEGLGRLGTPLLLVIAVAAVGAAVGTWVEYAAFARAVDARTQYVLSHKGSEACREGLVISAIPVNSDPRLLNNREVWVVEYIDQVSCYFDCKLIIR
jgi:hypothetical protein